MKRAIFCSLLALALGAGCASCDDESGIASNNTNGQDMDSGTNSVASNNGTNTESNNSTTTGQHECPVYQDLCDGTCIPTQTDPDNCGGCGVVCGAQEACSGGQCQDSCLPGLEVCDRECVNTRLDNRHCGGCGLACDAGEGCVDGTCVEAVDLDFDAASCANGGPDVDLSPAQGVPDECAGNVAELTFRWGICSCEDFTTNNELDVDAFDSTLGPYQPGGFGGGVGVNGRYTANNPVSVTGAFWVAGAEGMLVNNGIDVKLQLQSGGNWTVNSASNVGRDATVKGDIITSSEVNIAGKLVTEAASNVPGSVNYASVERRAVNVPEPCTIGCAGQAIDVASIVAAFEGNNDNAVIGLESNVLLPEGTQANGATRIDLPCGRYYLDGINSNQAATIIAHGKVALFVGGDVVANNPLTLSVMPGAQLDIFVAGNFTTNNEIQLGSQNYPAMTRLYVGGENGFISNNPLTLGGYIYAVPGGMTTNNEAEIYGGIFTQSGDVNNPWRVHFDRAVARVGDSCDPDPDPDPDPELQCGREGDSCQNSACCNPFLCVEGTCQLLDCVPAFGACDTSDECCSGTCSGNSGICVLQ